MAQGKQALKRRVRSVESTKKITKAMELVATAKLKRDKEKMDEVKVYADLVRKTVAQILSLSIESDSPYLQPRQSERILTIVFTSNIGLAGGYNANVFRMCAEQLSTNDPVIVVGQKGNSWFRKNGYNVVSSFNFDDNTDYRQITAIGKLALSMYIHQEVAKIRLVYTQMINSVTFQPKMIDLLPVNPAEFHFDEAATSQKDTIFEPDPISILNRLVPMYIHSVVYGTFIESKTSEQASRRLAMENATDNAEELKEKLVLQFNRSRQAAITQEISEIVGGAEVL